jgi:NADH-quinone oxidoreductase subunit B
LGTISKKNGAYLGQVYEQMSEPRWVIAVGACASQEVFSTPPLILQGIDKVRVPVDVT